MSKSGIYIKPSKRGSLHDHLGVPRGKKIPRSKLSIKASDSPAIRKKKQFAINARSWNHEDGGELIFLPEYGFGSWIKENGAGLLKGAGSLVSMIPGIGQIAGPVLNIAGSAIGGAQAKNAQEDAAQAEADAMAATQAEEQRVRELETRRQNIVNTNQIDYGPSFMEFGGQIGMGMMDQPQITDYSNGNTHQEGIGGIPVDARGNPSATSRSSAVGMTEKGEVTWNGYVFSNKLKLD